MLADNFGSKSVKIEEDDSPVTANRLGKFILHRDLFRKAYAETRIIFEDVTIVRAEMLFHEAGIEYIAYSPHFEIISEHGMVPEYVAELTRDEFGKIKTMKWVKR